MKNWIIFTAVFILSLSLVISVLIVWKADAPFNDMEQKAEQLALDTKALAVVSNSYVYNGNKPYVTVFGVDEYGKEKAIFVPMSLDENSMQEVFLQDGINKDQALEAFRKETSVKEILHTKLGFEEPGAVWEITYIGESGKLNYVYLLFEDGNWWKRILNL
ncbi:hypothetical protein DCE79_06220 [Lysinibacillus sp. 2017]|uniref:cell wall elongation regulator TseB-like domain-containing protein n=1 Tax=unclassified Lysinibacillus TaxID=2636778 RepID=UPI000D528B4C|nr:MULTISPECIES: DUF5590 domain-containing protein [unclassified Lysinibacillus]AWE07022.1 hypothetical protein DCE79_06220 [Lysinibacillus sp. 2017]TGN37055.1 hypothetical protein E4L99_00790 [Lysinibacillus sp. S2017]